VQAGDVVYARPGGPRVRRTGAVFLLRRDGVLGVPEHQPAAVQGVRPDGRYGRPGGLEVSGRGDRAARGGADQRLEGARPAPSAHRAGHGRGHVERPAQPPPPATGHSADRRSNIGGRSVTVLHHRVVGVAGNYSRRTGRRAVTDWRPTDAIQRHQLVRGRHDHGRVADGQVRRGRRHHSRGWHTGNARLRVRGRQRGLRLRIRGVHRPGPDRARPHVRIHRRRRQCPAPGVKHRRPASVVPGRCPGRQPLGCASQLLPRPGQASSWPRQAAPVPSRVRVRAAHVRATGG